MPRILVVEDNPADTLLLAEALQECGQLLDLQVVQNGEEALEYLRRQGRYGEASLPDLVLLDLDLPRKNGSEVLREMKSDPCLVAIPVIVLTTSKSEADIRECYRYHANCYIPKPLHFDDFIAVIRNVTSFWLGQAALPTHA